ncbi:dihydrodipicolinate synthase family protein [Prolixibacteraceae bacterium Z1-6]|uniref:Dihydrodipicolinate synthase family protein n=1 Tax=Draconibacterium aestuarii TaxID=2998507 RepID=A0A9X3F9A3_9BACT|nr:dihydrodipicolinate synthase family protein [Prolixibacteraceae bacterium Z1-6]
MEIRKLEGLIAAPFTPMKQYGSINPGIIPAYANKLKTDNVKGTFVCGTTGEGTLMTNEERKAVAEKWIGEQTDDFKVIVHVGTTSAKQSKELAEHAQKSGAYATGTMGPVFLRPSGIEELIGFCSEVASGAPDLPFYYYHIPSVSGIDLSMYEFLQKAPSQIPNLAGIKFTHNNFMEMQQCLQLEDGKWDILHGYDEMLLAGLSFGAKGAVGSTYNFMAPIYREIITDFENGDIEAARKKQSKTVKIIEILLKYNGALVAGKAVMNLVGIDCGTCRNPLRNLTDSETSNLTNELVAMGFKM